MRLLTFYFIGVLMVIGCKQTATVFQNANTRPNVLFIAIDDLRTEIGCYGSEVAITPNMDRLAEEGLLFKNAFCQQAICGPSRASLLTGLRPETTGITHNYLKIREQFPDIVTLPQYFKENGYQTQYAGKIFHHGDRDDVKSWNKVLKKDKVFLDSIGVKYGFALKENQKKRQESREEMFAKYGEVAKYGLAMGPAYEAADVPDNFYRDGQNTDVVIDAMEELSKSDAPFFLGLGFNKPHLNWVAPKRYWDLYDPANIQLASKETRINGAEVGVHESFELRVRQGIPKEGSIDDSLALKLKHAYLACVSYVDAQLGRAIEALEKNNLRENTIIIVWSDHGYYLGELGIWGKATNYELATHVPMMIWTPSMKKNLGSTDALVELIDIYPSLCDLAGLDIPDNLDGKSFKPLIKNPNQPWKEAVVSQFPSPALREWGAFPIRPSMRETYFGPLLRTAESRIKQQHGEDWDQELFENHLMGYAVRTKSHRMVAWKDTRSQNADPLFVELYDLDKDPMELKNIVSENSEIISKLKDKLNSILK